jgi:hypothetical protein
MYLRQLVAIVIGATAATSPGVSGECVPFVYEVGVDSVWRRSLACTKDQAAGAYNLLQYVEYQTCSEAQDQLRLTVEALLKQKLVSMRDPRFLIELAYDKAAEARATGVRCSAEAMKLAREAAAGGSAEAQRVLALAAQDGFYMNFCSDVDMAAALHHYEQAASSGNGEAALVLARAAMAAKDFGRFSASGPAVHGGHAPRFEVFAESLASNEDVDLAEVFSANVEVAMGQLVHPAIEVAKAGRDFGFSAMSKELEIARRFLYEMANSRMASRYDPLPQRDIVCSEIRRLSGLRGTAYIFKSEVDSGAPYVGCLHPASLMHESDCLTPANLEDLLLQLQGEGKGELPSG